MAKRNKKRAAPRDTFETPTPEQMETGAFHRELVTYRRTPVIDVLFQEHKLTQRQYDGLSRYRTVAVNADRSELRSCIDFEVRGNGEGQAPFGVRTNLELDRLHDVLRQIRAKIRARIRERRLLRLKLDAEIKLGYMDRELRDLLPIVHAVAVRDMTLSQWAVSQSGGKERTRGNVTSIEPSAAAFKIAWMDVRMAGERLAAEIGA